MKTWDELSVSERMSPRKRWNYLAKEMGKKTDGSTSVTVTVKNASGALAGASVSLTPETGTPITGTSAETTGIASLSNVPYGEYTLTVSKTGYDTSTETVTISNPLNAVEVTLTATATE